VSSALFHPPYLEGNGRTTSSGAGRQRGKGEGVRAGGSTGCKPVTDRKATAGAIHGSELFTYPSQIPLYELPLMLYPLPLLRAAYSSRVHVVMGSTPRL